MRLYQKNAKEDANGVCMPIPEKETDFNCTYFDFVINLIYRLEEEK